MTELVIHRERLRVRYFPERLGKDLAIQMILVPGGVFEMGSLEDESGRNEDEGPQHKVEVASFFIGRYPVTQTQWRFVAGLPQVKVSLDPDPSYFKGSDRPVEQITWYEAEEFCKRMAQHTGRPYRLPSEAEWEYACRAGTKTPFSFGKTITTDLVNYNGHYIYDEGSKGKYREETTPVGEFPANAYGLQDMHGNVFEWCVDRWHYASYEEDWVNGSVGQSDTNIRVTRVIRGGYWGVAPAWCRSAFRFNCYPGDRGMGLGFRVVCSPQRP